MLWSRRREEELNDEIASHLAMARSDGRPTSEFGNVTLVREITREMWGWGSLDRLLQDIRYGLRTMRRAPAFTAVAVLSLALGIGANTAIFSLIDTLMLRSLPVREPDQLVELLTRFNAKSRFNAFSWPTYRHLRDDTRLLDGLAASAGDRFYTQADGLSPERIEGQYISGNYFPMLGIRAALGRLIGPEDDRTGRPAPVAVVSWSYWQSRYHGDPNILGKRILLEEIPATIIGVTPPGFYGLQTGLPVDISIPLALDRRNRVDDNGSKWLRLIGRRKPGIPIAQVRAEMAVLFRWTLGEEAKINDARKSPSWIVDVEPAGAGLARLRDQFSNPLLILMAIVGLLLLIACANVASMLLARASARQREMAVRAALGAGRMRILRQVVTESLLLSAIAASLGLLVAIGGSNGLVGIMKTGRMPIELDVRPDLRVLAFTALVAMFTGLLFGLAPALQSATLRRNTETKGRRLFGRALVAAQVALSVILLSGAGLFVRNLVALQRLDLGFRRDHVLLVALDPSHSGYTPEQLSRGYQALLEKLQSIPGVRSASLSWIAPISGGGTMRTPTSNVEARPSVYINWVAPRFLETMGMPLLTGRDFTFQERPDGPHAAIINQGMARRYFGDANPLGERIAFGQEICEIIGVTADSKYMEIRESPPDTMYLSVFQTRRNASQFAIRTAVTPSAIVSEVRRQVRDVLKTVPTGKIMTLDEHVDASIVQERLVAMLSGLFGGLGALLAAIGLYGLLAYTVARRTNEIGIRMAIGAQRNDVLRMILRDALVMVGAGLVTGAPAAFGASRLAGESIDGWTIAFGVTAMLVTGLLAAWIPARRAARVDPMVALRWE